MELVEPDDVLDARVVARVHASEYKERLADLCLLVHRVASRLLVPVPEAANRKGQNVAALVRVFVNLRHR